MKIGVIGAGVSGMTIGNLLEENSIEYEVLEKKDVCGGIARVKSVEGVPYHMVGGHCFNSKNENLVAYVFEKIMPKNEWVLKNRKAKIHLGSEFIDYPIELNVAQIKKYNKSLYKSIVDDFLCAKRRNLENLGDWFVDNFGRTLSEIYFLPYNKKIWGVDPKKMSSRWVFDKLPMPNVEKFVSSLKRKEDDDMPHKFFYYPKSGNQNTFLENLSRGLNIKYNYNVVSIEKKGGKFIINGEKTFDKLVVTMPLDELCRVYQNTENSVLSLSRGLRYNKITTVLWRAGSVDFTWLYMPSTSVRFHRAINVGGFVSPERNYIITEVLGGHELEDILKWNKPEFLFEAIDHNISNHAYVVYYKDSMKFAGEIKKYFKKQGISLLGRFAEWEYYNMDVCMMRAFSVFKEVVK
ncbi:MAG: nucleotidyl-sugar pyranose mutase [Bacteroidetes bacterium]|nr:MAG: nucleotidyl-sugar pyranose mutase [Bacteroidota bacterium]